jgi:hypothetical protein
MTEQREETFEDEIRLDGVFSWVWRGKWLILALVIVASGVSAILALRQPELHNAAALVEVGRVWGKPLKDIYVTVEIANSQGFVQEVAVKAGVKPGQLARSVQVAAVESGVPHSLYAILIRITARNESADEAVRLAQAVADEIIARHEKLFDDALAPHLERQHELEERLRQLKASPADRELAIKVEAELDDVRSNNSSPISSEKTHLAERVVPGSTIRPDVWRGAATAGVIALLVGIVAACLIGYYKPARQ